MGLWSWLTGGDVVHPTPVRRLAEFEELVLDAEVPVIVDVWSPTCAPCKKLAPVLVELATEYAGRVRVVEISTEAEPELLAELQVRATPTLVVYKDGDELGREVGFRPKSWFREMIAKELAAEGG